MRSGLLGTFFIALTACGATTGNGTTGGLGSGTGGSAQSGASTGRPATSATAAASSGTGAAGPGTATGATTTGGIAGPSSAGTTSSSRTAGGGSTGGGVSASCTRGSRVVDSGGNVWTIAGGVVEENGAAAGFSANVVTLAYVDGTVYQENNLDAWYGWATGTWTLVSDPTVGCGAASSTSAGTGGTTSASTIGTGSTTGLAAGSSAGSSGGGSTAGGNCANPVTWNANDLVGSTLSNNGETLTTVSGTTDANNFNGAGARTSVSYSSGKHFLQLLLVTTSANTELGLVPSTYVLGGGPIGGESYPNFYCEGVAWFPYYDGATNGTGPIYDSDFQGPSNYAPSITTPTVTTDNSLITIAVDADRHTFFLQAPLMIQAGVPWNDLTTDDPLTFTGGAPFSPHYAGSPVFIYGGAGEAGTTVTIVQNPSGPVVDALVKAGYAQWGC